MSEYNHNFAYVECREITKAEPMTSIQKSSPISQQISVLEELHTQLHSAKSIEKKLEILSRQPHVVQFLQAIPKLNELIEEMPLSQQYVVKSVIAIGQGPIIFEGWSTLADQQEALEVLVENLLQLEQFYDTMGGIVGYQLMLLKLVVNKAETSNKQHISYEKPQGPDISKNTENVKEAVRWGVEALRHMAEIFPLGGAGDRLNLQDEATGEHLPAAQLQFCGHTLLEGLIRDLQGREFLYYKLFEKQLMTPIAMMTSDEKNNNQRLMELCEQHEWFGRTRESFCLFRQPLVPMVTVDGEWVMLDRLKLHLKPGGHGALWKVAQDRDVFAWLEGQHRSKIIVRQINNPVAAIDNGLLSLAGIGTHNHKDFGFASCYRLLNTPEGMDVLKEVEVDGGYEYCITNIEYTEFKHWGIEDAPEKPGSEYSRFPSNTNILFADLKAIKKAVKVCPLPGILLNMKNRIEFSLGGRKIEKLAGRLETTMQNIADFIVDKSESKLSTEDCNDLRTFLTYNDRRKTISVVKQAYEEGKTIVGTPEGCFFDLMQNHRDLLVNHCGMELPAAQDEKGFLANGPNFVVHFHPAFGVLYSVMSQKIRKGRIAEGSELVMEIAEADIVNLDLSGSLIIEADAVMGRKDQRGVTIYDSESCGKCTLINVKVRNEGYERTTPHEAWQNKIQRHESLRITLQGNGEFYAADVEFTGDMHFVVPRGHRLVVYHRGQEIAWHFEKITSATWKWDYTFDTSNNICLEKIKSGR